MICNVESGKWQSGSAVYGPCDEYLHLLARICTWSNTVNISQSSLICVYVFIFTFGSTFYKAKQFISSSIFQASAFDIPNQKKMWLNSIINISWNENSNIIQSATTNATGYYVFSAVNPGEYTISTQSSIHRNQRSLTLQFQN